VARIFWIAAGILALAFYGYHRFQASKPVPRAAILQTAPAGDAGSPPEVLVEYYDVIGKDYGSVLASLNSNGPYHGRADWRLSYGYEARKASAECAVDSVSTRLELKMTLPRWSPPPGTSATFIQHYEAYVAALKLHENGHLEHGRAFENELKSALRSIPYQSCPALDGAVRARYSELLEEYRQKDLDYDARTAHGKTQGAWFSP
jgi:predicted secreted Zn-dependent protease